MADFTAVSQSMSPVKWALQMRRQREIGGDIASPPAAVASNQLAQAVLDGVRLGAPAAGSRIGDKRRAGRAGDLLLDDVDRSWVL